MQGAGAPATAGAPVYRGGAGAVEALCSPLAAELRCHVEHSRSALLCWIVRSSAVLPYSLTTGGPSARRSYEHERSIEAKV